jgi:hypothetical protein
MGLFGKKIRSIIIKMVLKIYLRLMLISALYQTTMPATLSSNKNMN